MKLVHLKLPSSNFGDDLNPWMWPRLLPGVFDDDESLRFLGVGSIINHWFDGPGLKVVMGAGVAGYGRLPVLGDRTWRFYFVRGPATCAALGLEPSLALGDAAILLRRLAPPASGGDDVAFMPHWQSLECGRWAEACDLAGVRLIDSRWPVETVLAAMAGSRLILCEAMHGAIVADVLGVPWVAIRPIAPRHRAKWFDWADALDISLRPRPLLASSPAEWVAGLTRRQPLVDVAQNLAEAPPMRPLVGWTTSLAADSLRRAATQPGQLSDRNRLDHAADAMMKAVARFESDWRAGRL